MMFFLKKGRSEYTLIKDSDMMSQFVQLARAVATGQLPTGKTVAVKVTSMLPVASTQQADTWRTESEVVLHQL